MSKEKKFRAWDGEDMHYGNDSLESIVHAQKLEKMGAVELMQFTGLKDRNGKEIYEHDLIIYTNNEANGYVDEVPGLTLRGWEDIVGMFDDEWFDGEKYTNIEVIGNKFEKRSS